MDSVGSSQNTEFAITSLRKQIGSIINMKDCVVCSKNSSCYKCPRCSAFYCSVVCCRQHKSDCSNEVSHTSNEVNSQQNSLTNELKESLPVVESKVIMATQGPVSETSLLTAKQKEAITSSPLLLDKLKSQRLKRDISTIDSSADRQTALKRLRSTNKEFEAFVQEMVKVLNPSDISA